MEEEIRAYEPFWGNWYLDSLIGEGSFGSVYKIKRQEFERVSYCAMKIIGIPKNEKEVKRILVEGMDEAAANRYFKEQAEQIFKEIVWMSELKGKTNIVSYEDHQVIPRKNKLGYYILIRMELLKSLNDYALDHAISNREVVQLGKDICRALILCQNHNILHRDIKPDNIFVSGDGDFKLGDFGIAKQQIETGLSLSVKGSYEFMAPEVLKGYDYDQRVDIYSLGVVLYTFLNNRKTPFLPVFGLADARERSEAVKKRFAGKELEPPFYAKEALSRVVLKACAFQARDRYGTAEELLEALLNLTDADIEEREEALEQRKAELGRVEASRTQQLDFSRRDTAGDGLLSDTLEEEPEPGVFPDFPEPAEESSFQPELAEKKGRRISRSGRLLIGTGAVLAAALAALAGWLWIGGHGKREEAAPVPTAPSVSAAAPKAAPVFTPKAETPAPTPEGTPRPYEAVLEEKGQKAFDAIEKKEELTALDASGCGLTSIEALRDSRFLESLELRENRIQDIGALRNLERLQYLSLSENKKIVDIEALKKLTALVVLSLDQNKIKDISALKELEALQTLNLEGNQVTDLSALSGLSSLQFLDVRNNRITDLTALSRLKQLKQLLLSGNPIKKGEVERLKKQLPNCDIIFEKEGV